MNITKEDSLGLEALIIVEQIKPLLAGKDPRLQSMVLAELLSILLAGHFIPGEPNQTTGVRRALLSAHCTLVWELTEVNAKIIGTNI